MANLKITLVHGLVHSTERQRANVKTLVLHKIVKALFARTIQSIVAWLWPFATC